MHKTRLRISQYLTVAFVLFMLQLFVSPSLVKAGESNGFRGTAQAIQTNQDISSKINAGTNADWYVFTTSADTTAITEITFYKKSIQTKSIEFSFYDGDPFLNTVEFSYGLSDDNFMINGSNYSFQLTKRLLTVDITSKLKANHKYYLKVSGASGDAYEIFFSMPPYSSDSGFRGSAKPVQANQVMAANLSTRTGYDWYTFTTSGDASAVTEIALSKTQVSSGSIALYLYDGDPYSSSSLTSEYTYSTSAKTADISSKLRPNHRYYLKVSGKLGDPYTLYVSMPDTPSSVSVTGVALSKTNLDLTIGGVSSALSATVSPVGATNKEVSWKSDNPAVATVDSTGQVTPVAAGTARIIVTTADGTKSASCTVTVTAPVVIPSFVKGDANGDGKVTIMDAVKIARSLVGLETLAETEKQAADYNGDGKVSIMDAQAIAKSLVGGS